jgi:putative ABC transport system permease protein
VAVRQALGADRVRLMRQMLLESVVLSTGAGLAGLLVAWWGLRALLAMLPTSVPLLSTAGLDWRVVAFTFGVSALTGLVFGMVPALQAIRLGVTDGLRDGGRGTIGHRRAQRMRNTLVVAEVAMAVVMLIGAALLTRTVTRLLNVESGFRSDGVLAVEVALPRVVYGGERPVAFFESLTARLAAVPGVEAVGVTSSLPLSGTENLRQITIEGRPQPAPGQEIISDYRVVSPGYFRVMGIPLIDGEPLPAVPAPGSRVLLVNRQLAETYFPGEFPIGRRLKLTAFDQPGEWFTIGGVVGNTRHTALDAASRPQVYVHHRVEPYPQMVTVLHTGGDPQSYAGIARAAVLELDRDQPVGRIATMAGIVSGSIASRRFTMVLVVIFAALALLLSLVGLYAVVSHSVAARTRELGVRLALGASPAGLLRLVIFEGLKLVAVGVVLGLAGALLAARFIQDLLFGVSAYDLATFVGVPLLLLAAAIAGCTVPARRAMRVDPMTALRAE